MQSEDAGDYEDEEDDWDAFEDDTKMKMRMKMRKRMTMKMKKERRRVPLKTMEGSVGLRPMAAISSCLARTSSIISFSFFRF